MCDSELMRNVCADPECESSVFIIIKALRQKFGIHALQIAISQLESASVDSFEIWRRVVRLLRG